MAVDPVERKLAAIFAADIAGYSRLMARDEVGTLARLKVCRAIIDEVIALHRGRIFNTAGDSVVADFASAVDAVQRAVAVQAAIATRMRAEPSTSRCNSALACMSAMSWSTARTCSETALTSQPGWRTSPSPARSASRPQRAITSATSCRWLSMILAISRSKTSRRRSGCIEFKWSTGGSARRRLPLPDKPSIAVLPFPI